MLKKRIEILEEANIISKEVAVYSRAVIDLLAKKGEFSQEKLEMFTTHLAMATQRVCMSHEVDTLDENIWEEVRTSEHYETAKLLYAEMIQLAPCEYPEAESKFLIMHICNIYQD